jgi:hypothetical protein
VIVNHPYFRVGRFGFTWALNRTKMVVKPSGSMITSFEESPDSRMAAMLLVDDWVPGETPWTINPVN